MFDALLPATNSTKNATHIKRLIFDFERVKIVRHIAQALASLSMISIKREEEDRKVLHMTCCQGAMIQDFPGFS